MHINQNMYILSERRKRMDRWRPYMRWLSEHEKVLKAAAIVIILIVAVVFFARFGEESDNSIDLEETQNRQAQAENADGMEQTTEGNAADAAFGPVYVDIGGCVRKPGVYQVVEGTRLFEVIKEAGGLTAEADVSQINQAETVTDGQKVVIPAIGEENTSGGSSPGGTSGTADTGNSGAVTADGKVNINKADSTQLQELPGVGPATAEKILDYRQTYGAFKTPEDIKNVSGIGDKTYEKMKDKICV